MKKTSYVYKSSSKNSFAANLLLIVVAFVLIFIGIKFFEQKGAIVIFAMSIAVSYCKIAVEAIEKLLTKKFDTDIISTVAVLIMFASQEFKVAAVVAVIYSFSRCMFGFINAVASDKLLLNDENRIKYSVMTEQGSLEVFAEDLEAESLVKVKNGDFLSFSYFYDNGTGLKRYKPGVFKLEDEAVVTVESPLAYEIDFSNSITQKNSNIEKRIDLVVSIYTVAMVLFAVFMFVKGLIDGKEIFQALFVLGTYLLFANPVSINSGIINSIVFMLKSLRDNGTVIDNTTDLEKLSNVKKIVVQKEGVVADKQNNLNTNAIKAMKIASVYKINTVVISDEDEASLQKTAQVCCFNDCKKVCDEEEKKAYLSNVCEKDVVAFVTDNDENYSGNVLTLHTKEGLENHTDKSKLNELVKSIKKVSYYKWFAYIRVAVGVIFNFAAVFAFLSGKVDKILNDKLVDIEASITMDVNGEEKIPIMKRIIDLLLYEDTLAPWVIALMHLVMINLFLIIAISFLDNLNNDKKLR